MKRYALIDNGIVVSVAIWDGVSKWNPGLELAEDIDGVAAIGVRYENGRFILPPPPEPPVFDPDAIDTEELNRLLILDGSVVRALAQALFTLANEVRALQGKPDLSLAQFKNYIKGLMR